MHRNFTTLSPIIESRGFHKNVQKLFANTKRAKFEQYC